MNYMNDISDAQFDASIFAQFREAFFARLGVFNIDPNTITFTYHLYDEILSWILCIHINTQIHKSCDIYLKCLMKNFEHIDEFMNTIINYLLQN